MKIFQRFVNADSHHRVFVATGLAIIAFLATSGRMALTTQIFGMWDVFSLGMIALIWIRIIHADPQNVRRGARLQDSSRTAIFVFVIVAACASLLALGVLLVSTKGLPKDKLSGQILLSLATVLCSWLLVHTVFTLRYAHSFYRKSSPNTHGGGLVFPEEKEPDYLDFAYFSFVIGMTCQVSDVQITSRVIRRLALVHGLVSFAFNTFILAIAINIIITLLQ